MKNRKAQYQSDTQMQNVSINFCKTCHCCALLFGDIVFREHCLYIASESDRPHARSCVFVLLCTFDGLHFGITFGACLSRQCHVILRPSVVLSCYFLETFFKKESL